MNIAQMMKQAQVMQERMKEMQERLGETELTATAGNGLVNVVMTCNGKLRKINIDPKVVNPNDVETLEDLIIAAINSGKEAGDASVEDETRAMMAGMGLPAGMKLPF
jgi:DNA-binding YbaB/EbfC family protein